MKINFLKILTFILILGLTAESTKSHHKKHRKHKQHKGHSKLHKNHRKKHKKRRLFLPGGGGGKYTDPPAWNLKALNLTTKIPIVVMDKKKQNPLFVVPQIISKSQNQK